MDNFDHIILEVVPLCRLILLPLLVSVQALQVFLRGLQLILGQTTWIIFEIFSTSMIYDLVHSVVEFVSGFIVQAAITVRCDNLTVTLQVESATKLLKPLECLQVIKLLRSEQF